MTAQLEAMAIAARLDLLAYFLGMARAESEIYVPHQRRREVKLKSSAGAAAAFGVAVALPHRSNSFE